MDTSSMFEVERSIIDGIDDIVDFQCFLGTLVDDWLEQNGYSFEAGTVFLKRLIELRLEVRKLLGAMDPWYANGDGDTND